MRGRGWMRSRCVVRVIMIVFSYAFGILCITQSSAVAHVYLRACLPLRELCRSVLRHWTSTRFDAERWRQCEIVYEDETERMYMVDDLLERYSLQGMSRREVRLLLGKPDAEHFCSDADYAYYVGLERGFIQVDPAYLVLRFDEAGKVTKVIKVGF